MGSGLRHGAIAVAAALLVATQAVAAGNPAQVCQSKENKEAGKYAFCRQKAYAKYLLDPVGLAAALVVCDGKFQDKWGTVMLKANGACPSPLDAPTVGAVIVAHTDNIADALAGGPLPDCPGQLGTCTTDLATCNGTVASCQGNLATYSTDLAACQATPSGQLLKTGLTTCSDATGASIPCAGTGQDGELQRGLARSYVDNGDGTISDLRTGLMWEKLIDDGGIHDKDSTYSWTLAFGKIATLNGAAFAGHSDWRLPNQVELLSLVNLGAVSPATPTTFNATCAPGCIASTCSCTSPGSYWSSSPYAGACAVPPNPLQCAWTVAFSGGSSSFNFKTDFLSVRAVRGGV